MSLTNATTGKVYNPVVPQVDETPVELSAFDEDFEAAFLWLKVDASVTIVGAATTSNTGYAIDLKAGQLYPIRVRRVVTSDTTLDNILIFR